jgi:inner membrane protein
MASIFAHGVIAVSLGKLCRAPLSQRMIITGIILSILPDMDVLTFYAGIPYESVWGHRGFTHSIAFAFASALSITFLFRIHIQVKGHSFSTVFIFFFLCMASHGFLDAMTTGGKGVGFFIPFNDIRYFFGYRPILVSPIGIESFFSSWGLAVLKSEMISVGTIAMILVSIGIIRRSIN